MLATLPLQYRIEIIHPYGPPYLQQSEHPPQQARGTHHRHTWNTIHTYDASIHGTRVQCTHPACQVQGCSTALGINVFEDTRHKHTWEFSQYIGSNQNASAACTHCTAEACREDHTIFYYDGLNDPMKISLDRTDYIKSLGLESLANLK